jgi:hypothetical protein
MEKESFDDVAWLVLQDKYGYSKAKELINQRKKGDTK